MIPIYVLLALLIVECVSSGIVPIWRGSSPPADDYCPPNLGLEPFGIVFVEALTAGRPVLSVAIGGVLQTVVEARMAVFDFIEGWYNPHRRHSAQESSSCRASLFFYLQRRELIYKESFSTG